MRGSLYDADPMSESNEVRCNGPQPLSPGTQSCLTSDFSFHMKYKQDIFCYSTFMFYKTETSTTAPRLRYFTPLISNRFVKELTRRSKNTFTIINQSLNLYYVYFISHPLILYVYLSIMSLKTIRR
jgi:hypothetical protein